MVSLPFNNKRFDLTVSNSAGALNSRPEFETEQYNYSLSLTDFISNSNKGLNLAFLDKYNHYDISLKLSDPSKSFAVGYEMEVFEFRPDPSLERINHSIKLIWTLGKNK